MTDYDNDAEKDSVAQDAGVFGYDKTGHCHRYDPVRGTVFVTVDGEVVHTEQLAPAAVPNWIEYVADKHGWIDQWFGSDVPQFERHQQARAQAADIRYQNAKTTSEATA